MTDVSPFASLEISAWSPSDWQSKLPELLAFYNVAVGEGAIKVPAYADAAERNVVVTDPVAGDVAYIADGGSGAPVVQVYSGTAWLDMAVGPAPVAPTIQIPVYADDAARDIAVAAPVAGDLVYITDAGAAAPAVQVHDGVTWGTVWPAGGGGTAVSSPDGSWVYRNDIDVYGVNVPFAADTFTDVSTVAPNAAGAKVVTQSVVSNGSGNALRLVPSTDATKAGAVTLPLVLADGDSVVARFSVSTSGKYASQSATWGVQLIVAAGEGADRKYTGAGMEMPNSAWTYGDANSGTYVNNATDSVAGGAAAAVASVEGSQVDTFDVSLTRVGVTILARMRFGGGGWNTPAAASANGYPNTAGTYVGVRVRSVDVGFSADLIAFAHIPGGMP